MWTGACKKHINVKGDIETNSSLSSASKGARFSRKLFMSFARSLPFCRGLGVALGGPKSLFLLTISSLSIFLVLQLLLHSDCPRALRDPRTLNPLYPSWLDLLPHLATSLFPVLHTVYSMGQYPPVLQLREGMLIWDTAGDS